MKRLLLFVVIPLIICFCFVSEANSATMFFRNFKAVNGVAVSVPYKVNAGTRHDPDTVTLTVDLTAPVLEFQLTVVGAEFPGGDWGELEWENEGFGAPREDNVPLIGGGFSAVQNFNLNPARLNLTDGGTRSVLYELEADEEPYLSLLDTKRYLQVIFLESGPNPQNPVYPSDGSEVVSVKAIDYAWAAPVQLADSDNFFRVTEHLYRSAQPSAKGMRAYERFGIQTVINLRGFHSDVDEVRGTELTLLEIPTHTWDADKDEFTINALQAIRDSEKPVLVHCQHGADRTGLVIAAYRVVEYGWSKAEAVDELRNGGFGFHSIWQNIPEYIEQLDVEKIRNALH
jgi:protein tyrosine phosphatase (PTP) superfamily phosphohydrolase (DUF442 family)